MMCYKDDYLTEVKNDLLTRIQSTYKKRSCLPPINEDEQRYTVQVLKTCEQYFTAVKKLLDSQKPPFMQPNPEREKELWDCLTKDNPTLIETMTKNSSEEPKPKSTYLSKQFTLFDTRHLQKALMPINSSIASILPYLLTSYYINISNRTSISCLDLFCNIENVNPSNYKRLATDFQALFFLENFIPKFIKKNHLREATEVQKIKDSEGYKEYLKTPHKRRSPKILAYNLTEQQYNAIFQAFSYSLCVLACMSVPQISNRIDYDLSFNLFQQHTQAFSTVFWIDSRKMEGIGGEMNVVSFITIEKMLESISPAEIQHEIEGSEYLESLKMSGISASDVADCAKDSISQRKNEAISIVYKLHPCEYPGWWKFEDANFPNIRISITLRLLPYMDIFPEEFPDQNIDRFLGDYILGENEDMGQ